MDKKSCLFNTLQIKTWVHNKPKIDFGALASMSYTCGTETFAKAKQATLGKNVSPECMNII